MFAAALAVSLMTGSVVAQARDHDRDDRHERYSRHDERGRHHHSYGHDDRRNERRHWDDQHDYRRAYANGYRHGRYDVGRYYRPYGYRVYSWQRGHRLPAAYYAPRYIVHDYHDYHLHSPPHGHHWVRVDHDVVLAAIATGAIVHVVNDLFY